MRNFQAQVVGLSRIEKIEPTIAKKNLRGDLTYCEYWTTRLFLKQPYDWQLLLRDLLMQMAPGNFIVISNNYLMYD